MNFESWQFFALGSAFFAGLTALFAKMGVQSINSNLATFIRTVVILLMTAIVLTAKSQWERLDGINAKSLTFLILSGVATGLSWLCYYRALQIGTASQVAPLDKLSVVFVIALAALFLGEKLNWQIVLGGALVVAGSCIIAFGAK